MAEGQTCPVGHEVPAGVAFCPQCGAAIAEQTGAFAAPTGAGASGSEPTIHQQGWDQGQQPGWDPTVYQEAGWQQGQSGWGGPGVENNWARTAGQSGGWDPNVQQEAGWDRTSQQPAWQQGQQSGWDQGQASGWGGSGAAAQGWGQAPWQPAPQPARRGHRGAIIAAAVGAAAVFTGVIVALVLLTSGGRASNASGYPSVVRTNFVNSCRSAAVGQGSAASLDTYCNCVFDKLSAAIPFHEFQQDELNHIQPPQYQSIISGCASSSGLSIGNSGGSGLGSGGSSGGSGLGSGGSSGGSGLGSGGSSGGSGLGSGGSSGGSGGF